MNTWSDVVIIGAGGAGMMCAIHAGKRGRKVTILDHSKKLGGKILISGGGRCNFTNQGASPAQYISKNPHFCKSALSRYPADHFIQMVQNHKIAFHEKKLGQLFCDGSAQNIVHLLKTECDQVQAQFLLDCKIISISKTDPGGPQSPYFEIKTTSGLHVCRSLVIATGGLSIPKLGASGFGYEIARQFGLKQVETAPALDGFVLASTPSFSFAGLAGISLDCEVACNGTLFRENILFTHSGLSGPAALQASLHWNLGDSIQINLLPDLNCLDWILVKKKEGSRALLKNVLSEILPSRFVERFCNSYFPTLSPLSQISEKALISFCDRIHHWQLIPSGTVGYSKAEVTRGGVDTDELSSKTLEAKKVPGLYFIGEVVDVTGWLGGYNFQWAWASGWAAGQTV